MQSGAKAAVKYHNVVKGSAEDLLHDLRNVPRHYFGSHTDRSTYFCTAAGLEDREALYLRLPKQVINVIDAALQPVLFIKTVTLSFLSLFFFSLINNIQFPSAEPSEASFMQLGLLATRETQV